jgi:predicted RNA-binding Zn-ribbon protein involved in translation (DUF1610 family)
MIGSNCPGSIRIREPIPEIFTCPKCGAEVEIWTNELKGKCSSCGEIIAREIDAAYCIQWCHYAKECIGAEKYEELLEAGAVSEDKKEDSQIPEKLKKFIEERGISIPGEDAEQ